MLKEKRRAKRSYDSASSRSSRPPKRSNACSTGPFTPPIFTYVDRPRLREDARHCVFIDVLIKSVLGFDDAGGCPWIDLVTRRRKVNGRSGRVGVIRASKRCELVAFAVR